MPTEPTAAQRIRDSIAALREHAKGAWEYRARSVFIDGHDAGNIGVPGQPSAIANAHFAPGVGDYVTTLASPHVGEALANLLEARRAETLALATWVARQIPEDHARLVDAQHALTRAFAALEAAILREAT